MLYSLSTFVMLALVMVFLYWALENNLVREDRQFLADKIHVLRVILKAHADNPAFLDQEVRWEGGEVQTSLRQSHYSRILDRSGTSLLETPGMAAVLPSAAFPSSLPLAQSAGLERHWSSRDGRTYLLMAATASVGEGRDVQRIVQVALDVSHEERLIADYRRKLIVVLALGILMSVGIGAWVARRGMRPLQSIARTAERITVSHLHERLHPESWPRELVVLAQALDRMLARLEDSFSRLEQFSADLAHELRTPINNLMGEAEVALSRHRTPEEYRQALESSLEEYQRLARMIESLLFLARAEGSQDTIERVRLDARSELEAVRDFHEAVAEEQGVTIVCEGEASLDADALLLRRALSNLLANALRYTPRGGRIVLAARGGNESVELSVRDTGCGIAPPHLPKVFDRFYRADSSRAHYADGTGLGLAIVKSIMDLHGGSASLHSEPGVGTTVTLAFPARAHAKTH